MKTDTLNGMELAKAYYEEYGRPMIQELFPEYADRIAVGLVGKGSDCFGFDDEFSADHDYGPDFCLWVSDETYKKIGKELEEAYSRLPVEFKGFKRTSTGWDPHRRGVFTISGFYKKYLGTDQPEEIDYEQIPDYSLAAASNGEVFRDDEGIFSAIREKIKAGYPDDVRLKKIEEEAAGFSRCGQYNFPRMLKRGDEMTAGIMLADSIRHAMKLYHHIMRVYPPHDKWLYKSLTNISGSEEVVRLLDEIRNVYLTASDRKQVLGKIEELGHYFARVLYALNDISDVDPYLDHHAEELLFKAGTVKLSSKELVDRIVRLEFEAFDKVENEGGRAYCQDDWATFSVMRKSQYLTWNDTMLIQYLYDFDREYRRGHNLITEKYGRMMESTAPTRYAQIKDKLSELSEEQKEIINRIVDIQMTMMEDFAKEHPKVAGNARILHTYEDNFMTTSYETYLRGEISTYSDKMLQLYGRYVVDAFRENRNIAGMIIENTAKLYGYKDLKDFETGIIK